jgi:hypothetical protein
MIEYAAGAGLHAGRELPDRLRLMREGTGRDVLSPMMVRSTRLWFGYACSLRGSGFLRSTPLAPGAEGMPTEEVEHFLCPQGRPTRVIRTAQGEAQGIVRRVEVAVWVDSAGGEAGTNMLHE